MTHKSLATWRLAGHMAAVGVGSASAVSLAPKSYFGEHPILPGEAGPVAVNEVAVVQPAPVDLPSTWVGPYPEDLDPSVSKTAFAALHPRQRPARRAPETGRIKEISRGLAVPLSPPVHRFPGRPSAQ